MTFKKWISYFEEVDLPIGDLAKDISNDPSFPDSVVYEEMSDYLMSKGADSEVLDLFRHVFDFFLASA